MSPTQVGSTEIVVEPIEVNPNPVQPGDTVTVVVSLKETAEILSGTGLCNPPELGAVTGIATFVEFTPEFAGGQDRSVCVPMFNLTAGRRQENFQVSAPQLGEGVSERSYNMDISVTVTGKEVTETISKELTVTGDAQVGGCATAGDCPDGYWCNNGECVPETGENGDGGGLPGTGDGDGLFGTGISPQMLFYGALAFVGLQAVESASGAAEELAEPEPEPDDADGESAESEGGDG